MRRFSTKALSFAVLAFVAAACGTQANDEPKPYAIPGPAGKASRIRDISNPKADTHLKHKDAANVSGAVVVHVDTFDETQNGKSTGTIYVQDIGADAPLEPGLDAKDREAKMAEKAYAGISLFAPTFVPGNLKVGPGDVLDMSGQYQENGNIGTAQFPPGAVLSQISQPTATFRLETPPVKPVVISFKELGQLDTARRWSGMLVTLVHPDRLADPNAPGRVKLTGNIDRDSTTGRYSLDVDDPDAKPAPIDANSCKAPFPRAASLANELFNLRDYLVGLKASDAAFSKDQSFKSITGVVTFFCNFHISPRSAADFDASR